MIIQVKPKIYNYLDAEPPFTPSKSAERKYQKQLESLVGQIEKIVNLSGSMQAAGDMLKKYAVSVEKWSAEKAAAMVAAVNRKNYSSWQRVMKDLGFGVREMLETDSVSFVIKDRIRQNIKLISSIMEDSQAKVAEMAVQTLTTGERAESLVDEIAKLTNGNRNRARMIARTEVSTASTALTMVRAQSAGCTGYIWRTSRDGNVRPSHSEMEGQFVRWDNPVTLDGMVGHAGEFPNCRCYPEPVIPNPEGGFFEPLLSEKDLSRWEKEQLNIL